MSKKNILIIATIIFIVICSFIFYIYLIFDTTQKPKNIKTKVITEEEIIRNKKEEDRLRMIEMLNQIKAKNGAINQDETPEAKEAARLEMISDLNDIKETEEVVLTPEEKEASRIEMIEKLNSLKAQ